MKAGVRRGQLLLVGTPIGNRGDLSPRAREALLAADLLLCEDTRSPLRLVGVELPPRISCFAGNESRRTAVLLRHLARGERVVYVSEAGMPVWSDPGERLVRAALDGGHDVDVIPGPTAASMALSLCGFSSREVRFVGFPARSGGARARQVARIAGETATTLVYEAGNRVGAFLAALAGAMPDAGVRRAVVARELTKVHQEILRGTVAELAERTRGGVIGEATLVIEGRREAAGGDPAEERARAVLDLTLDEGLAVGDRARRLAALTGLDARLLYRRLVGRAPRRP